MIKSLTRKKQQNKIRECSDLIYQNYVFLFFPVFLILFINLETLISNLIIFTP